MLFNSRNKQHIDFAYALALQKVAHEKYGEFFSAVKPENFIRKFLIFFSTFAQNIDCVYTEAVLTSTLKLCVFFVAKIRKICIPTHTPFLL